VSKKKKQRAPIGLGGVGDTVLYWHGIKPLAAIVIGVTESGRLNLHVFADYGDATADMRCMDIEHSEEPAAGRWTRTGVT